MSSAEPAKGAFVTGADGVDIAAVIAWLQQEAFVVAGLGATGGRGLP